MAVSAIEQAAHTGLRGDRKIYVCDVNQAVRISSGERDEKTIYTHRELIFGISGQYCPGPSGHVCLKF